jgi:hypothetical protein
MWMERFAVALPGKSSAPPITTDRRPSIKKDGEPDRSALSGAIGAPKQCLFRVIHVARA